MSEKVTNTQLRRTEKIVEITSDSSATDKLWFVHSILAQCFLPYRDTKTLNWEKKNGDYAISVSSGRILNPSTNEFEDAGLPYGAKPRLFQTYVCTKAIKNNTPVISVENSMTALMSALGLKATGGKNGSISGFKEQIKRFAACNFTIVGKSNDGQSNKHFKAPPIKSMDIWFPTDPSQGVLWPSEIVLTDDYFYSLKDHAIPFDYRALNAIQNNSKAIDTYLWCTQRLCRIPFGKPVYLKWADLYELFGGELKNTRMFPGRFKDTLSLVHKLYPEAKFEVRKDGIMFYKSSPPIKKVSVQVEKKKNLTSAVSISEKEIGKVSLNMETYEIAKKAAPGLDVYYIETQWRDSLSKKKDFKLVDADKAFVAYCKACYRNASKD